MSSVSVATVVQTLPSESTDKEKGITPETTSVVGVPAEVVPLKGLRRFLLVACLCLAQYFDIFTACSAIAALPTVRPSSVVI